MKINVTIRTKACDHFMMTKHLYSSTCGHIRSFPPPFSGCCPLGVRNSPKCWTAKMLQPYWNNNFMSMQLFYILFPLEDATLAPGQHSSAVRTAEECVGDRCQSWRFVFRLSPSRNWPDAFLRLRCVIRGYSAERRCYVLSNKHNKNSSPNGASCYRTGWTSDGSDVSTGWVTDGAEYKGFETANNPPIRRF